MTDLTKIAFEHVYGDYHRGRYGDFEVIIRLADGYINVTNLCAIARNALGRPKRFFKWTGKHVDEMKAEASKLAGIPVDKLTELVQVGQQREVCGTYAHPDLVPHIASWASPAFAMRVSRIVNAAMAREYERQISAHVSTIDDLTRKIEAMFAKSDQKQDAMHEELKTTNEELKTTNHKLDNITAIVTDARTDAAVVEEKIDDLRATFAPEQIAPVPTVAGKEQTLVLTRVHTGANAGVYKMTRCQVATLKRSIAKLARDPGATEATVLRQATPCANPIKSGVNFLEAIRAAHPSVAINRQTVRLADLAGFSEADLIRAFDEAVNERNDAVDATITDIKGNVAGIRRKLVV